MEGQPGGTPLTGSGTAGVRKQNNRNEERWPTVISQKNRRFVNVAGMLSGESCLMKGLIRAGAPGAATTVRCKAVGRQIPPQRQVT